MKDLFFINDNDTIELPPIKDILIIKNQPDNNHCNLPTFLEPIPIYNNTYISHTSHMMIPKPLPNRLPSPIMKTAASFANIASNKHPIQSIPPKKSFMTKNAHIKRPRNAWIHFRCHYSKALKLKDPTLRAEEISRRASLRWSTLSEIQKKPWHDLAEKDKQAHKAAFPGYRYCPKRSTVLNTMLQKK